ncbi:hypothetical protein OSB04_020630 [Centaurea solstitialis]|uniref:GrpE protein homolog n=1 Tax=Centaurea solstitialis TaxID=347529 RepID=A0AA38W617_9ASTR|nr:hypothetical protein OSB04_020630 [Centaurea solstitialis]
MAMASAATTTTTSSFQRTPPTRQLPLTPNRITSYSKLSCAFLQRSSSRRQPWPSQLPLVSSSISFSRKLSSRLPLGFVCCSADETLVTDEEKEAVNDESQPQCNFVINLNKVRCRYRIRFPSYEIMFCKWSGRITVGILASLQSYKEALADNDDSKIAEIETHFKSIEDEKLVLERKLATLSEELSSARDRVLRISADFDNFRKRTERERLSLVANAQGEVVENLLGVLDNFERAKSQIKIETEKEEKINNSYQSIYKQFVEVLGSLGVESVETVGQPFDPLLHEAIMREDSSEFNEGVVIQEFRKGFKIGERLLRPSMVKVSAGPGPETGEPVSPSESEASVPGAESVEEAEDVENSTEDQSEPAPADDE